uniref:Anaphase-promoting complex subunit 4 WD40 domain-containing protein n=1 Tax=Salix viminalis TaxID=40686 RepID=A0A6N2LKT9_SALVM
MDAGSMNTSSSLKAQSRFPLQQQFLSRTNSKENVSHGYGLCPFHANRREKGKENPTVNSPSREAYKKQNADSLEYQPNSNSSFQEQASRTDIVDGFYLNLLDWNVLAITLGNILVLPQNWSQLKILFNLVMYIAKNIKRRPQIANWVNGMAWNNHILTTGGMDGQIISYNIVETLTEGIHEVVGLNGLQHYQVCALLWNKNERELLSSHGFTQNQLTVWKYPSMVKMAELRKYPSMVKMATAAGDETLRFWNVFGVPEMACS